LNPLLGPQSLSAPYQSTTDSIDTTPINGGAGMGPNLIDPNNTVYGIVTDNNAVMFAAKYKWDPFKFFAGYEYIWQNNPANPLGVGASDQGGYIMSGVEDNNLAVSYTHLDVYKRQVLSTFSRSSASWSSSRGELGSANSSTSSMVFT